MTNAETDLLRESIDRLTHDERPPGGLADRAFRRHRQRTIALRAAAAGTAVVAAGVLATATLPGAAPRPGQPGRPAAAGTAQTPGAQTQAPAVQTAAYVSGHTERALAAAAGGNLVEEIHTVGQNYPLGLTQVLSFPVNGGGTGHLVKQAGPTASQENTWSYRGQLREQGLDATGQPVFDASSTTAQSTAGARTVMTVRGTGADYTSRTWWRSGLRLGLPPAPGGDHAGLGRRDPDGAVLRALPAGRARAGRLGERHQAGLGEGQRPLHRHRLGGPVDLPAGPADLELARPPGPGSGHPDR
jgi:hypothetical protein